MGYSSSSQICKCNPKFPPSTDLLNHNLEGENWGFLLRTCLGDYVQALVCFSTGPGTNDKPNVALPNLLIAKIHLSKKCMLTFVKLAD